MTKSKRQKMVEILLNHRYDSSSQDSGVNCICYASCYVGKTSSERIANHIADLIEELG